MMASRLNISALVFVDECLSVVIIPVRSFATKDPAEAVGKPFSMKSVVIADVLCYNRLYHVVPLHLPVGLTVSVQ